MLSGRKAIIYARVSTTRQASGHGLVRQVDSCTSFAAWAGLTVLQTFEDRGEKGSRGLDRPALKAAIEFLKAGHAEYLLVEHVDRLARTTEVGNAIRDQVESLGGQVIYCEHHVEGGSYKRLEQLFTQLHSDQR